MVYTKEDTLRLATYATKTHLEMSHTGPVTVEYGVDNTLVFYVGGVRCMVALRVHTEHTVKVSCYRADNLLDVPILWYAHQREHTWVILYLIAGHFKLPGAAVHLHMLTAEFCEARVDVPACRTCGRPIDPTRKKRFAHMFRAAR